MTYPTFVFDIVVRVSLLRKIYRMYSVAEYELSVERNFDTLQTHGFDVFLYSTPAFTQ
jgi:hypothetical protein